MVEFFQSYGLWIVLIAGMYLMHRLGIGCCGGHGRGHGRRYGDTSKAGPRPTDSKASASEEREGSTSSHPHRRGA